MSASERIRFYAATDVGSKRDHNEDNFLVDKKLGLFMVADGMGGHAAGEVASAMAVRTVHEEIKRERSLLDDYAAMATGANRVSAKDIQVLCEHAVQLACSKIHDAAAENPQMRGMGTTLSALLVVGHQGFIAHVGDSRIYLLRQGRIEQVTEDHTVYQELIKRGKLTLEQIEKVAQKNAITRAVGVYERVEMDPLVVEVLPEDTFLLASDGLTGYLESANELRGHLELEGDLAVKSLIKLALDRGGRDNVTAVVVRIGGGETSEGLARAKRLATTRAVLAKMPIFAKLTDRELLRVMQAFQVRECDDGQVVIREGDRGDELFVVLDGQLRVTRGDATLAHLGPGQHVGEMALIRSAPRSATVTAVGHTALIGIRRPDFFEILRGEHEIAVKMLWQFLTELAQRLEQTSNELQDARRELAAEDVTSDIFPDDGNVRFPPN
jgi:serine/threonine protein phosphatase PrpC